MVFALAAWAGVATAPSATTATIDISSTTPFNHNWKEIVGSGHMLLGTRADWRAHLRLARDELGMKGIRGHGLLDDDMSVLPRLGAPPEFYNVDQILGFLVELGMKPVVELSFMPKALAKCHDAGDRTTTGPACSYAFHDPGGYKGMIMPPADFNEWYDLVKALAEHLVWRFGLAEVASWKFEVWNEMWGVSFPEPYMSLYNSSARALKAVDASLKVGGPATMQTLDVPEFIANASAMKIPVDFVSSHYYPTDPQCQTDATKAHIDCFAEQVLAAQRHAHKAGLPFWLTEYNNGLGGTSRDDSSAAAFVFRTIGLVQALDAFSWWTFTDVFEEGWMRSAPFHNGYGMMTVQGVRKPVWRAFEALEGAGSTRYAVAGVDPTSTISVLATDGGGGALGVQAYVANWHRVDAERFSCSKAQGQCVKDPHGEFTDEALCNANCHGSGKRQSLPSQPPRGRLASSAVEKAEAEEEEDTETVLRGDQGQRGRNGVGDGPTAQKVTVVVTHAADAAVGATARAVRIDGTHANPQALWASWGSPQYVNTTQEAALHAASQVAPEQLPVTRLSATQSAVTVAMAEYSALHLIM